MLDFRIAVPLLAFAFIAFLLAVLVRRGLSKAGDLASDYQFAGSLRSIAHRADVCLGELAGAVDEVRRGKADSATIEDQLRNAGVLLDECAADAREIARGEEHSSLSLLVVEDIERAQRAIDMIQHGCAVREAHGGHDPRLEGDTSIKRGYLNLLHAREAIRLRELTPPAPPRARLVALLRRRAS